MDSTIQELIIQELITRAAVIRTTGSPQEYATDIGETVLRSRPKIDPEELPCCIIWPQVETAENIHGKSLHKMPVKIEGIALFSPTDGLELIQAEDPSVIAGRILGDLIKCFTSPLWDRRRLVAGSSPATYLAPYMDSIIYQGGGRESAPEDSAVSAAAHAMFMVGYYTAIGDPFAQ